MFFDILFYGFPGRLSAIVFSLSGGDSVKLMGPYLVNPRVYDRHLRGLSM